MTLTFASPVPDVSAQDLFDWHARPGAFQRLVPPWAPVRLEHFDGIQAGDRAVIRIGPGPLSLRWIAEHHDVIPGRQFCDRQVQGPFAHWNHTHRFEDAEGGARLTDRIEYALPAGPLGEALAPVILEPELTRQFAYRHRVTRRDLALHQRYNPEGRSLTVAISGSSGLVGSQLTAFLQTGGHEVRRIVRSNPTGDDILWNARTNTVDAEALDGVDAVVHLAGENVFGLWTEEKKKRIRRSRLDGTRLLAEAVARLDDPPEVFLSASAVGYYGHRGGDVVTEEAGPGEGFLSQVCQGWESAAQPVRDAGIRTVHARIGIVLTPAGGALQVMLPAFLLGLGGRVGAPTQFFPWITLDDVLGGLYHCLFTEALDGPVNLTAPEPVTMQDYTDTLAGVLRRPALLNVPTPVVRAVGGEMAQEMLLKSCRAVPTRLQDTGYAFGAATLEPGLRHVLGRGPVTAPPSLPAST